VIKPPPPLQACLFKDHPIGIVRFKDSLLLVVDDLGAALQIEHVRHVVHGFSEDRKQIVEVSTSTGQQRVYCLTRQGVNALIFLADRAVAREFRTWLRPTLAAMRRKPPKMALVPPQPRPRARPRFPRAIRGVILGRLIKAELALQEIIKEASKVPGFDKHVLNHARAAARESARIIHLDNAWDQVMPSPEDQAERDRARVAISRQVLSGESTGQVFNPKEWFKQYMSKD